MQQSCKSENIKVLVRIRPDGYGEHDTFVVKDGNSVYLSEKSRKQFTYDCVADENSSQEQIFQYCKNLFEAFIDGYNATIFAFGQTGSGKTYTMTGITDEDGNTIDPGIIPRGLKFLFDALRLNAAAAENVEYLVKCSFVEIYNENIYDLLGSDHQRNLNLRFNLAEEVSIESLTEKVIKNPQDAEMILKTGLNNRHVASTKMNRESSRSHSVFSITLESCRHDGNIDNIIRSNLYLVDLAGSESQRDSQSQGERFKEGCIINKSLLMLERVITAHLEIAKGKKCHIPVRDSKLTFLLKDAIGGNSKTCLIACVHPSIMHLSETWATLNFAARVKTIRNKAKIKVDAHGDLDALRREVLELRQKLEAASLSREIYVKEGYDSFWLKQFMGAMTLYNLLTIEVTELKEKLAQNVKTEQILMECKHTLQLELDRKNRKLKALQRNNNIEENIIKFENDQHERSINAIESELRYGLLQDEIQSLTAELTKMKRLEMKTEAVYMNCVIKEYYNVIKVHNFDVQMADSKDMDVVLLNKQLADCHLIIEELKKEQILTKEKALKDRMELKSEIAYLKASVEANKQKRKAVFENRRKTMANLRINDDYDQFIETRHFLPFSLSEKENIGDSLDSFGSDTNVTFDESMYVAQKAEIAKLQFQLNQQTQEVELLREQVKQQSTLEEKCKVLKDQYDAKEMELLNDRDKYESLFAEFNDLRKTYDAKLLELEAINSRLEVAIEDNQRLMNDLEMMTDIQQMLEAHSDLSKRQEEKQVPVVTNTVVKCNNVVSSVRYKDELSDIIRQLDMRMCEELQERLRETDDRANYYSELMRLLEVRCQELDKENNQLSLQMEECRQECDNLNKERSEKMKELEKELEKKIDEVNELQQELKDKSLDVAVHEVSLGLEDQVESLSDTNGNIDKGEILMLLEDVRRLRMTVEYVEKISGVLMGHLGIEDKTGRLEKQIDTVLRHVCAQLEIMKELKHQISECKELQLQDTINASLYRNTTIDYGVTTENSCLKEKLDECKKEKAQLEQENIRLLQSIPIALGQNYSRKLHQDIAFLKKYLNEWRQGFMAVIYERMEIQEWLHKRNLLQQARKDGLLVKEMSSYISRN